MSWKTFRVLATTLLNIGAILWVTFRWVVHSGRKVLSSDSRLTIGYIRQSVTRLVPKATDADGQVASHEDTPQELDMQSPERQRANILNAAQRFGLVVSQIFEDANGHKSGADTANRPAWLTVEQHIKAGQVSVLILNDLSRAHRKGWRIGQLIAWLEQYKVRLILAAPEREIDLNTLMGKMFVMFIAMVDEYYVLDASIRQKDSAAHRRAKGMTNGMPPAGTVRRDGVLVPTRRGAWLLADGRRVAGMKAEPPEPEAIWRGYSVDHDLVTTSR